MTASLQGEIKIRTGSIDEAIQSIGKMGKELKDLGKQDSGAKKLSDEFQKAKKAATSAALSLRDLTKNGSDYRKEQQRIQNLLAKAASSVANFSQRVEQSGATQERQNQIIAKARQELEAYRQNLATAGTSGLALQTANTQLSVSMAELGRELKESTAAGVAQEKTLGTLQIAYERLTGQIRGSGLSEEQKNAALQRANAAYQSTRQSIEKYGRSSVQATQAQNRFKTETVQLTQELKNKNTEIRKTEINKFNKQMTDLTGSVQLALGPLSGVASRIQALTGLFKRNAAPIAALVASFTAFTVSLNRTIAIGREAERQMLALDSQVGMLGMTGVTSGAQLNEMARRIADSTLTSAQAVRESQSALMEFRNIGVGSFESVLLTAQGLAQTFGGSLSDATRRLGRLLNDPISNFDALSRQGITFNEVERERLRTLVNTGRLQQAQNIIMERFAALQERAKNETAGLSGQLDALGDNAAMVGEKLFFMAGVNEEAAKVVKSLSDAVREFGESDAALSLADKFAAVIRAAGAAVEFLINNIRVVSAIMTGFLVSGVAKAILGLGGYIKAKVAASGATVLFTRSLGANITAMRTATTAINAKTLAVRTLGTALRFAVPIIGIAVTALEMFGVINLFTPSQQAQMQAQQDQIEKTTKRAKELRGALEQNTNIEVDLRPLTAAERMVAHFEKKLKEATEARDALERPARNGMDWSTYQAALNRYNRELEAANTEVEKQNRNLQRSESYLRGQVEATERAAQSANNLYEAQQQYTLSVNRAIEAAKSLTDSEGSRIDSINKQILALEDLLHNRDEGIKISEEEYKQGLQQLEMLVKVREEMRKNSRAHREAERSALRLLRIQSDLSQAQQRATIYTQSATQADADYALRLAQREQAVSRNVERVTALSDADQVALARTLGLSQAQITLFDSSTTAAQGIELIARKLEEQAFAADEAQRKMQALVQGQNVLKQLEQSFDPLAGARQQASDMAESVLLAGFSDQEQAEALKQINKWFELERDTIMRQQDRLFDDTMRFHPLTETEQLQRDFEDRQAVLRQMYAEDEEALLEHMAKLQKAYEAKAMFVKFGENAQLGADMFNQASELMVAAGRQSAKEYQAIAIGQAAIAQAMAISKVWADNPNPLYAIPMTALIGATLGAQIASIRAQNFNTGGFVSGKGTGKSDSIPANLSNGEFVLQKRAVDMLGIGFLNRLNKGEIPSFNNGGYVAPVPVSVGSGSNSGGLNVQVIDQSTRVNGMETEVVEGIDANGERQLKVYIRDAVRDLTSRGEFDRVQQENFGNKRRGIRR